MVSWRLSEIKSSLNSSNCIQSHSKHDFSTLQQFLYRVISKWKSDISIFNLVNFFITAFFDYIVSSGVNIVELISHEYFTAAHERIYLREEGKANKENIEKRAAVKVILVEFLRGAHFINYRTARAIVDKRRALNF